MARITRRRLGFVLALFFAVASSARAADEVAVVKEATKLLEEISSNPESGIPTQDLREARGIAIVPRIVEAQLGVGRKKGHGVFLSRKEKGEWGNPEPFEISGSSVGAQAGCKITDLVIIYRTQKAADGRGAYIFTLGLEASGSLKRRKRFSRPWSDSLDKETLVYRRHRGIVVGAAISGEHQRGRSDEPVDSKTPRTDDRTVANRKAEARVKVDSPNSVANAQRAGDSPEVARLKKVLTAMTTSPPEPTAATGTKDMKVRPASAARPRAETAASTR